MSSLSEQSITQISRTITDLEGEIAKLQEVLLEAAKIAHSWIVSHPEKAWGKDVIKLAYKHLPEDRFPPQTLVDAGIKEEIVQDSTDDVLKDIVGPPHE